jgi:hypothetical protein
MELRKEKKIKAADPEFTRMELAAMVLKKSSAYYDNNPSIQNYDWLRWQRIKASFIK